MTVNLYTVTSNTSSRKTIQFLEENNVKYVEQNMIHTPLSWEQLFEILMHTENGVEDILSTRSRIYKDLLDQGVDFDELSLTELYSLVAEYPRLLKAPIMVSKNVTLVGYNEEDIQMLTNRKDKKKGYLEVLDKIRAKEDKELGKLKRNSKYDRVVAS